MNKKNHPRMEFSKKIFYMVTGFTVLVTMYSMALMWITRDSSALSVLIPAVFAEFATATGFYYSKAKKENEIKLKKLYGTGEDDSSGTLQEEREN
ncbi:hypothetical protein [Anaerolentibacter hominis]|uniref:hypothetical protein n=1 Tax=Anaerolentibacter hominis TaxID=3079009 RepID=UPI0031B88956